MGNAKFVRERKRPKQDLFGWTAASSKVTEPVCNSWQKSSKFSRYPTQHSVLSAVQQQQQQQQQAKAAKEERELREKKQQQQKLQADKLPEEKARADAAAAQQAPQQQGVPPNELPQAPQGARNPILRPSGIAGAPSTGSNLQNMLPTLDLRTQLSLLDSSLLHCPQSTDSDRPKAYYPKQSFATPPSFPSKPQPLLESPELFERLDSDTLFLIFFYQQGTYQQYLAACELKRQSWRFHKKFKTWFQRHQDPTQSTAEYEVGTYVYFDYEAGWCQRIKQDFKFDYAFLE